MNKVALNALQEKKTIMETVERAVKNAGDILLFDKVMVGRSYPFKYNIPGIWVNGPDMEGRYIIAMSVVVIGLKNIPDTIKDLRSRIWNELAALDFAKRIKSINVKVEDLLTAA